MSALPAVLLVHTVIATMAYNSTHYKVMVDHGVQRGAADSTFLLAHVALRHFLNILIENFATGDDDETEHAIVRPLYGSFVLVNTFQLSSAAIINQPACNNKDAGA